MKQKDHHFNGINLNIDYRFKTVAGINNQLYYITAEWLRETTRSFLYSSQLNNTYQEISINIGVRF